MSRSYNRFSESLGNILQMEHVNLMIPDQAPAILFYVTGLGFTRDPFLMTGLDNMWINIGRSQIHLPRRDPSPQILRGRIGLVSPNLKATFQSLKMIKEPLSKTKFSFSRKREFIDVSCPWGNQIRIHAPDEAFGNVEIGLPYVEFFVPKNSAGKIVNFYREILGAKASIGKRHGKTCAMVTTGTSQYVYFIETNEKQAKYDGHHIAIYIADFAVPYQKLLERGLISRESDQHEWRFIDIVDLDNNKPIFKIEHEVRSATHPLFGRPLVNRNPHQSNRLYKRGQDNFQGQI